MLIIVIVAGVICFFHYRNLNYGNKALLYALLTLPAVFFSTNMLDEAVTVDESMYIPAFSDPTNILPGSVMWVKASYQYRSTQLLLATVFRIWRYIYPGLSVNTACIAYKIIHWFVFFSMALFISYIWGKYVLNGKPETFKYRLSNIGILYVLTGMPIACLLLKVCNYDSGNTYFALAGLSLTIVAEKIRQPKIALAGTIVSVFGCLEKWGGLIYWCFCVALYAFLLAQRGKTIKQRIGLGFQGICRAVLLAVGICFLNQLYLRILFGKGIVDFSLGTILFPLFFMVRAFFLRDITVNFEDTGYYNNGAIGWLFMTVAAIVILTFVICILYDFLMIKIKGKYKIFAIINFLGCVITVFSGIMAVFLLTRSVYPFKNFPDGIYVPGASMSGTMFFYGAKTVLTHIICEIAYANGVIIANIPSVFLLILFVAFGVMVFKCGQEYILQLCLAFATLLISVFTLAGQPAVPRYFSVTILLYSLVAVYYCSELDFTDARLQKIKLRIFAGKAMCGAALLIYIIELYLYLPVYSCFAPLWLIRSGNFKDTIRQGEWAAGEAMTWGEEIAIAGNIIEEHATAKGLSPEDIIIISNYGSVWFGNPGFDIRYIRNITEDTDIPLDETTYFVWTKFALYRDEISDFIYDTEPVEVVKYNGEKAVWIYTADQIGK